MYDVTRMYLYEDKHINHELKESIIQRRQSSVSQDTIKKEKSFKRVFERFGERTSMQGVGYINSAKFWYSRLIWSFLLIASTAGMTLHLFYLIDQYLGYPIQTKVDLGFDNLHFPAVTICNVNAIRNSKLYMASKALRDHVSKITYATRPASGQRKKRFVKNFDDIVNISTSDYIDYDDDDDEDGDSDDEDEKSDVQYSYGTVKDSSIKLRNLFTQYYRKLNMTTRLEIGHQLPEMLISCTIGKFKCYAQNFTGFSHEKYGNCYTLQFDKLRISKPGPESGLTLVMYMNIEDYLSGINEGFGARLEIHDLKTFPFPDENGLFIPSSSETQIGLRRIAIKRLGGPYGICSEDIFSQRYGVQYTRALCQVLCLQEHIYGMCRCYAPNNDEWNRLKYKTGLKYCTSVKDLTCMKKQTSFYRINKNECVCNNPCSENQFVKTISHRNWPTEDYMYTLKQGVCDQINNSQFCAYAESAFKDTDYYRKSLNYLKVNIYYEDLNYESITETPEIETAQFASDVGGAIGLWIGLSILSIFEVFQLFLELCAFWAHRYRTEEGRTATNNGYMPDVKEKSLGGPYMYALSDVTC